MRAFIKQLWADVAFDHCWNKRQIIILSNQQSNNRALGRAILLARKVGKPLNVIAYHYRGVTNRHDDRTGKKITRRVAAVFTYDEAISELRHFAKSKLIRNVFHYVPTFDAVERKFFEGQRLSPYRPSEPDIHSARPTTQPR